MARGVVKFFKPEKGWGAISSDELPAGQDAWVQFSAIEAVGYRALDAGDVVDFDYEAARQDSFKFRATRARRLESARRPPCRSPGARFGYRQPQRRWPLGGVGSQLIPGLGVHRYRHRNGPSDPVAVAVASAFFQSRDAGLGFWAHP